MAQRPLHIAAQAVTGTPLMSRNYTFNAAGNISQQTKDGLPLNYGYDALNQLTSTPEGAISYDPMGNRQNNPGSAAPWTVNALNQVTSDGFTTYGYNANGSLTSRSSAISTSTFNYNPEGRLSEVAREGNVVARYDYDVFNRRVKKVVAPAPGTVMPTVTYYLYSDEGLIGEYTATGEEQKAYGWKPHGTWGTDPVWQRSSHSPFSILHYSFFLTDHLGTPQKLITATGQTVWSASYDTFGRATVEIGAVIANGVKQSIGGSAIENNLRFPGQYFDAETGFHYNWHRYYIPELGRYNRLDPIKDDRNWYGYVSGNPINLIDGLGLSSSPSKHPPGFLEPDPGQSNCLGYALSGSGKAFAQPFTGHSMDEFLKFMGWTCNEVKHQDECKSDCDHDKIVIFTDSKETFYGKRPDADAKGWDFHGIRATKGCS
jgi:RHS repeat-associated protein